MYTKLYQDYFRYGSISPAFRAKNLQVYIHPRKKAALSLIVSSSLTKHESCEDLYLTYSYPFNRSTDLLDSSKDEINAFMASSYRKISAQSLYTAIPQLISRIIHEDVSISRTKLCCGKI